MKVLARSAAASAGVSGVLAQVTPVGGGRGPVRLGIDYGSFAQAYGGDYAQRLHLVELPACALTTPQLAACRVQSPLPSSNDAATQSVSADVTMAAAAPAASGTSAASGARANAVAGAATSPAAASASGSGDGGRADLVHHSRRRQRRRAVRCDLAQAVRQLEFGRLFRLLRLHLSAHAAARDFVARPTVQLGYDSGSVDGQTAATQAQSSWIGDGWSMADSYIEQSFVTCADQPEGVTLPASEQTGDMCYDGPILTMSLDGSSVSLIQDAKGHWHSSNDNGDVVTQVANSNNGSGTYNTDYWTVTDRSGRCTSSGSTNCRAGPRASPPPTPSTTSRCTPRSPATRATARQGSPPPSAPWPTGGTLTTSRTSTATPCPTTTRRTPTTTPVTTVPRTAPTATSMSATAS
ncbi:hypothetical protein GXW82_10320 [Streptacidiphilus sp. 4-A2]|nr:hypothetical protein [Streptacidiphilus sp. 4-A2]